MSNFKRGIAGELENQRMKHPKFRLIKAPMYVCTICGKVDNWGRTWRWNLELHGKGYDGWGEWKSRNKLIRLLQESPWGFIDTLNMLAFAAGELITSDYDRRGHEKIKACLDNYNRCKAESEKDE
jgi:hypothetical protein